MDKKYIDFSQPFDLENEYLIDPEQEADLKTAVADKLDEKQKIKLVNLNTQWSLSSIMHGEQGALSLSASMFRTFQEASMVTSPPPWSTRDRPGTGVPPAISARFIMPQWMVRSCCMAALTRQAAAPAVWGEAMLVPWKRAMPST